LLISRAWPGEIGERSGSNETIRNATLSGTVRKDNLPLPRTSATAILVVVDPMSKAIRRHTKATGFAIRAAAGPAPSECARRRHDSDHFR
jgi:hypothetical protein